MRPGAIFRPAFAASAVNNPSIGGRNWPPNMRVMWANSDSDDDEHCRFPAQLLPSGTLSLDEGSPRRGPLVRLEVAHNWRKCVLRYARAVLGPIMHDLDRAICLYIEALKAHHSSRSDSTV